jgi:hypothetical protein
MPGEFKVKNGLLVSGSANVNASGSEVFSVDGTSGRLFQVDDSLSGSLFSVNTAAGLPIIEAFSDNTVRIGQFGQRALFVSQSAVGIGKESALNATLDVSGSTIITGSLTVITGSSIEFQVLNTGVRIGNLITDTHTVTGSISISGSVTATNFTGSLFGTSSWAQNAVTASYALTASLATNVVGAANRILFNNATNTTTGSNNLTFDGSTLNVIGAITTTGSNAKITAGTVGGDEGGELLLGKPETNTTLTGSGVTIDIFQNRLRFFEQGGNARGYFIDITGGGAGVSTNLVGGGSGTPGGSNTQIQYNNAGAFGGVSTLTFDGTTLRATGSFTGSFTGSLLGTASFATTASFALNAGGGGGTSAKAGSGSAASFGGTPRTASITFGSAFSDNLYAVTVTGEDARSFTIQSKSSTGFTINSNSSVALTGPVYWIATAFN